MLPDSIEACRFTGFGEWERRPMREFVDHQGRAWDALVGKESWGTLVVIFSPRSGGPALKSVLPAETSFDAERELERMTEEELRDLVSVAEPWN